jgi:hypothetical protein
MFRKTCSTIRNSIYGVLCQSPIAADQVNCGNGTAFMIAQVYVQQQHTSYMWKVIDQSHFIKRLRL